MGPSCSIETVVLGKDGEKVTVNASDSAAWVKDGWEVVEQPDNDANGGPGGGTEAPVEGPFKAIHKGWGKWFVVKVVKGEEGQDDTHEDVNEDAMKEVAAKELAEKLNAEAKEAAPEPVE